MSSSRAPRVRDCGLLVALAVIPAFDAIVNQLSNGLQLTLGSVSLLQVIRGLLLVCFAGIIVWRLSRHPSSASRIPVAALGALLLLLLVISKESVLTGTLAQTSAVAYGQMTYWVLLWIVVSIVCTQPAQATILLRGLACGALITAASVALGYLHGGLNYYEDYSVHSSSGWFDTAKMITGLLVTGSVIILYLGRERKTWLAPILALFCCLGCMLTYARAGSVALASAVLWLVIWTLRNHKAKSWWALRRFLLAAVLTSTAVVLLVPADTLFSRWGDVSDSDQAGSGRATIWRVAIAAYEDGTLAEQSLGRGYDAMSELLLTGYGDDVKHTHNDLLDMLLVGGVAGTAFLFLFLAGWSLIIARQSIWTVEGGASVTVLLTYLCHSQLTGQLWGTDSMTYYVVALTSLSVLGAPARSTVQSSSVLAGQACASPAC